MPKVNVGKGDSQEKIVEKIKQAVADQQKKKTPVPESGIYVKF